MSTIKLNSQSFHSQLSNTIASSYLHQIAQIPLLKPLEEITYAQQVQRMMSVLNQKKSLEQQRNCFLCPSELAKVFGFSEEELEQILAQGKYAKNKMIQSNLRWVVTIAKKYRQPYLEFFDLIQEGNLGLEKAVEHFDPTKGYRFTTYSYWWIREAITKAIAQQSRTIRLPMYVNHKLNDIKKTQQELFSRLGRSPTINDIALELGIKSTKIREYLQIAQQPLSLNIKVTNDEDAELSERIQDHKISPFNYVTQELMQEDVGKILLEQLNPQEREVLSLRFGIKNGEELSLTKVAHQLSLSRERIRQLENKALKKLWNRKTIGLRDYLAG